MLTHAKISEIEARVKGVGSTVAELCREAGVAETTWGRWKRQDFHPSYAKAMAVVEAADRLVARKKEESAA